MSRHGDHRHADINQTALGFLNRAVASDQPGSRSRLKSPDRLPLQMVAAMIGYFRDHAYTGKYGLNARAELDHGDIARRRNWRG